VVVVIEMLSVQVLGLKNRKDPCYRINKMGRINRAEKSC
jgi:hypothetical protein